MKHIKVLTKRYSVDVNKNSVTCIVTFKLNIQFATKNSTYHCDEPLKDRTIKNIMVSYSRNSHKSYDPTFYLAKTAICKGDDKFNLETGIDVARHKVELKLSSLSMKLGMLLQQDLKDAHNEVANDLTDEMQRYHDLQDEIRKY